MSGPVNVDVKQGRLVVSERQHVDLVRHVYERRSDREILKELWSALTNARSGGA